MRRFSHEKTRKNTKKLIFTIFFLAVGVVIFASIIGKNTQSVSSQSVENDIDSALYRREEFFGSQAIVPITTAASYENLLKFADKNDPKVFAKLGELAEKLEKFDEAEKFLLKADNLDLLADFYHRRANYEREAEMIAQMLKNTKRLDVFERLITFAQLHDLNNYLQADYFQQVADDSENALPIIEKLIDKLVEENQTEKALVIIRNYKAKFPDKMLEKEVALLSPKEAEAIYYQAFNPFWSDEVSGNFYQFLSDNDRLRAYGSELKTKFRKNPADYQIAVRLIHYKQYDYNDNEITPIVLQLEKAKKSWMADELLTIARFLLKEGNGDLASKFLYTLHVRNEFTPEMRGKIAYQIFKILCNGENERLSLTKGDLNFYRDVASADTHPGIATGILSLIFSDTCPACELNSNEETATKFFNRAATFRVFQNYKKEFPNSPEIGQMYLDLIDIYTKAKDTELAEKLLDEFAANYEKTNDFPRVAMNLADAFVIAGKRDKEQQIYQKVMDLLGKEGKFFSTKKVVEKVENSDNYDYQTRDEKYSDEFGSSNDAITYADVLSRYIESLTKEKNLNFEPAEKEKKVAEILQIYSNEIAKYPEQEWLYERRLEWLEQTNLFDEQLKTYKTALERFPTNNWRDKLARWFIRQDKKAEFEAFSADLIAKLNDDEIESYLTQFTDNANNALTEQFRLKLYETAHQRFPHNLFFVNRLLSFYQTKKLDENWRNLAAEYFFESEIIRNEFLDELAKKGELTNYLDQAKGESVIYQLFRANINLRLSRYEEALSEFRKLNEIYPNNAEFSDHLVNLTRSFGQKDRQILTESADFAKKRADFEPSNADYRTEIGEINAELGDYQNAKNEWQKLIATGKGSGDTYLETASVYWDYFQYDEALKTIQGYRVKVNNKKIYAFEAGAILESQHKQTPAISEYLNALEDDGNQAQNRLKFLAEEKDLFEPINATFQKQPKSDWKTFYYAEILRDLDKKEQANRLLQQQIRQSKDTEFLESARDFSDEIEPIALNRLAEIASSPRKSISYNLRLADFYRENKQPNVAKQILTRLRQKFPTNYGVLTESADFYWSLGANEQAIAVLQNGFSKAKGNYRFAFASRLAKRLISLNRLSEAEQYLTGLHQEKPTDSDVFHELTNVYVREGKAENLRKTLQETITAIKGQTDLEPKEINWQIAEMRGQMIAAFTQLKDYHSAVEQHIEIINREPDEDAKVDAAIAYVKRYGGGDLLLNYYQKTAAEAFKNYRWNAVLAQIFEASGDTENAVKNYHKAIDSQPEMTELYAELVRIETKRKNYAEALKNLDQIIELSGENKDLLKQKIQLLQLLGRSEEAKTEQAKLPAEVKPIIKPENQFSEAEKAKSIEMFREAFKLLLEKPLESDLKAENITSYISTLRQEENLDVITERLFLLRAKLQTETERPDSKLAGEARNRLKILDGAMAQTIGNIAKTVATNEELTNLHNILSQKIDEAKNDENLAFLQNFSTYAGFGDLVETILIKRGNRQNLIDFYNERGAFQKVLEIAETEKNLPLIAENAKLVGNREKELDALRQLFQDKNTNQNLVSRYLQIVDETEVEALSKQNSPHQLQLINFLLGKGEKELAHAAIENSNFQTAWKLARNAETSLALKEFDNESECYFCDALKFDSIGGFINNRPDKTQHLISNDWFRLTREYGEWLDAKKEVYADKFLPAMTENLPKEAGEQTKLGDYYLAKNELEKAKDHFKISLELNADNVYVWGRLGEVLWRLGERQKAEELFENVFRNDIPFYLQTLKNIGLQRQAREKVLPELVAMGKGNEKFAEWLKPIADTFDSEAEKANFFAKLCRQTNDEELAEKSMRQNLIAKEFRQPFYEILVKATDYNGGDYEFEGISKRTFSNEDAEEIYDHEKDFKIGEDKSLDWQHEYLDFLLEYGKNAEAKKLILQLENDLKAKSPRPVWLRLAHFQLLGGNMQKLVGIEVTDNVTDVKPPNIERLNEAVALLQKLKRDAEANKLTLNFYTRMLELGNFETANYIGLARANFKLGDTENALKTLQKLIETENFSDYKTLAEIYAEFGQTQKAIEFRQKQVEFAPNDFENIFELALLLPKENSIQIWQSLVNDRNTPRNLRWQAIWKLHESDENVEIPNNTFDAYSQFYNGLLANDENYFLNSLIADKSLETQSLQQLIKIYANSDKPFAALKLSEMDKSVKNDELLDLLSKSAEKVGEFGKAIEFEKAKSKVDEAKILELKIAEAEKNKRVTNFVVDAGNVSGSLAQTR
ncbi:MAG: tetratricopeptide repeat protein [Pyrinomonadaceae bacterium]|nr:tetratricopeptide repeat protein [Pyrinomonadaceae bacterium]